MPHLPVDITRLLPHSSSSLPGAPRVFQSRNGGVSLSGQTATIHHLPQCLKLPLHETHLKQTSSMNDLVNFFTSEHLKIGKHIEVESTHNTFHAQELCEHSDLKTKLTATGMLTAEDDSEASAADDSGNLVLYLPGIHEDQKVIPHSEITDNEIALSSQNLTSQAMTCASDTLTAASEIISVANITDNNTEIATLFNFNVDAAGSIDEHGPVYTINTFSPKPDTEQSDSTDNQVIVVKEVLMNDDNTDIQAQKQAQKPSQSQGTRKPRKRKNQANIKTEKKSAKEVISQLSKPIRQARLHKKSSLGDVANVAVGEPLKTYLGLHPLLKNLHLNRGKRDIKKKFIRLRRKEGAVDRGAWHRGHLVHARNRLDDLFELTAQGQERLSHIKEKGLRDVYVVNWYLWCPGRGNCQRKCGGFGECVEGKFLHAHSFP